VSFIDTPGDLRYIKTALRGESVSDVAIVVVSAVQAEFVTDFSRGGRLRSALLEAFTIGIKTIIIAVSKLDHGTVNYSQ
jgi:translation elongation factor EF-1alpha